MELELREQVEVATQVFKANTDREDVMRRCESARVSCLYPHKECGEKGLARGMFYLCVHGGILLLLTLLLQSLSTFIGCGKCWAFDGNWKLTFAHCVFPVQNSAAAIKLSLPNVCPEEPKGNNAFCARHCTIVEGQGIPTKLKDFLAFSHVEGMICPATYF